ncbi:hypothetical protein LNTAR_24913 [Lentisphaera araneosa HTCC2155]|uniref:Uncharacterized protein n=2 Tax=Lentisphaera TaxID=256846 RepID=A6DSZ0_9BACT|nr:hypothetical protein LNTAR_24913 [Lentisphaera araneosa HTCC2155]
MLKGNGINIVSIFDDCMGIKYSELDCHDYQNTELLELVLELNNKGVFFSEDYKQTCSPAEFMKELQEKEILKGSFTSICWMNGEWKLKKHHTYLKYKNLKKTGTDIHKMSAIATEDGLDLVERFDMFKIVFELNANEVKSELNKN